MERKYNLNPKRILSYFNGKCRTCGTELPKGTPCWFAKHYGARCEKCGPHPADMEPLPPKTKKRRRKPPKKSARLPEEGGFKPIDIAAGFDPASRAATLCDDGIHRIEYGSVREIIEESLSDYAQNEHNQDRLRKLLEECLTGDDKWANHYTREKLVGHVFDPPVRLIQTIDKMREHLAGEVDLPLHPKRRIRRRQDWGDTLDVDGWLSRDPSPWERIEREQEKRRLVQIGCNLAVSWKVKPKQLLYRGAAALALADHLTRRGCSVGVTLYKSVANITSRVKRGVVKCQIKRPDMPMDLSALAFSMCEIAFFRCAVISAAGRRWPGILRDGFGAPKGLPERDSQEVDYLIDTDVLSESAAIEWLKRHVASESEAAA